MKRIPKRWLLILAVWLAIFAVTPFRYLAQSQLQNTVWPLTLLAGNRGEYRSYVELLKKYPNDVRVWAAAADEYFFYPQDDDLPATSQADIARLFPGKPEKEQNVEKRRRLDIVIEKFPNEPWLIAKRLKLSWGYMYGDRVGGELSDPNLTANKAAGIPSPERHSQKQEAAPPSLPPGIASKTEYPNYTPQELQRVLELCKRGQKLEPQNAYYDWTLSYFLTLSWRDKEGLQALESAAAKPQWETHELEEVRAQMKARELQNDRPLLWEERIAMAFGILFPQYARMREYARIASWQSIKAQRGGDHALALRIMGALAKVTAKMRDNSKFHIERLVAITMESIIISGATYDARQGVTPQVWRNGTPQQQTAARFNSFGAYATAHGRRDLAQWVAQDSPKAAAGRGGITFSSFAGTTFRTASLITILWRIGVLLLTTLPLCLLAYFALSLVVKNSRVNYLLNAGTAQDKIARGDIIKSTLACSGLNLLGFGLLGALSIALTIAGFAFGIGQFGDFSQQVRDAWDSLLALFNSNATTGSSGIWETMFYSLMNGGATLGGESDAYLFYANWMLALLPIVFGALWCAQVAVERQHEWQQLDAGDTPQERGVLSFFKAALRGRAFETSGVARLEERDAARFDFMRWFFAFLRGVGIGVFWVMWIAAAFWPGRSEALYFVGPLSIAMAIGVVLWMDVYSRWRSRRAMPTHRRRAARYGVLLLKESWLGWLALGSLLFFLTLLTAAPLRSKADAQLDRYLRIGEIAMSK